MQLDGIYDPAHRSRHVTWGIVGSSDCRDTNQRLKINEVGDKIILYAEELRENPLARSMW